MRQATDWRVLGRFSEIRRIVRNCNRDGLQTVASAHLPRVLPRDSIFSDNSYFT